MAQLTISEIETALRQRAVEWNGGTFSHKIPNLFAMVELAGEVGEACNEAKKLARTECGLVGGKTGTEALASELADVVLCAILAAAKYDINIEEAVRTKFNATSDKHGFQTKL